MRLSIIIPAHNEEATIQQVLDKVFSVDLGSWEKEVTVVNDGSTDRTGEIVNSIYQSSKILSGEPVEPQNFGEFLTLRQAQGSKTGFGGNLIVIHHPINLGKGAAIQTGLKRASGDYVIIQDADAEYDPMDIPSLLLGLEDGLRVLARRPSSGVVVLGKRGYKAYPERGFHYVIGAWLLTAFYNLLYHQHLTDLYTGYKLIPTSIFKSLDIQSAGFEFEAEVACKLAKKGVIIKEIPIHYQPRNKEQGKHIRFVDAIRGLIKIFELRIKN